MSKDVEGTFTKQICFNKFEKIKEVPVGNCQLKKGEKIAKNPCFALKADFWLVILQSKRSVFIPHLTTNLNQPEVTLKYWPFYRAFWLIWIVLLWPSIVYIDENKCTEKLLWPTINVVHQIQISINQKRGSLQHCNTLLSYVFNQITHIPHTYITLLTWRLIKTVVSLCHETVLRAISFFTKAYVLD